MSFNLKELKICGLDIDVFYIEPEVMKLQVMQMMGVSQLAYGLALPHKNQILINRDMDDEVKKATLFHEGMHIILEKNDNLIKVVDWNKKNLEEIVTRVVSNNFKDMYDLFIQIEEYEKERLDVDGE